MAELHEKMKKLVKFNEVYLLKWLQQKLIDKYKDLFYFLDAEGKPNVLCFKDSLKTLINDEWYIIKSTI